MNELEKIPLEIREKYGVDHRETSGLLFIMNPQPITIKADISEIDVMEMESGWLIRFNLGSVALLKGSFCAMTSIY